MNGSDPYYSGYSRAQMDIFANNRVLFAQAAAAGNAQEEARRIAEENRKRDEEIKALKEQVAKLTAEAKK